MHTPGPWVIYDDGPDGSDIILANVDGENWDIAYISNDDSVSRPREERVSNSRLIASAPALLEACKAALMIAYANLCPFGIALLQHTCSCNYHDATRSLEHAIEESESTN